MYADPTRTETSQIDEKHFIFSHCALQGVELRRTVLRRPMIAGKDWSWVTFSGASTSKRPATAGRDTDCAVGEMVPSTPRLKGVTAPVLGQLQSGLDRVPRPCGTSGTHPGFTNKQCLDTTLNLKTQNPPFVRPCRGWAHQHCGKMHCGCGRGLLLIFVQSTGRTGRAVQTKWRTVCSNPNICFEHTS